MGAIAQAPFLSSDSLTINNVSATVLVHGDMWWNGDTTTYVTKAFFPRGTAKSIGGSGNALWMSGYDGAGQLHISAQTYRQDGNDYWPGPVESSGLPLPYSVSHDWAKVWKVGRGDIEAFKGLASHTVSNTPDAILTWPGKGNVYAKGNVGAPLSITRDMAPFADLNGNGIYEPLQGEFPAIKGDQELWWIFTDNGPVHSQVPDGLPLGVEVKSSSYGYSRGTLIDNVVYYDFEITNRSTNNYDSFRLALRLDMDLGYYMDDCMGFDSTFRVAIQYNATDDDGEMASGLSNSYYHHSMPVAGVTIVSQPGDMPGSYTPAGSFTVYYAWSGPTGMPAVASDYSNYMRARKRDGTHYKRDASLTFFTGDDINYVFDEDPSVYAGFSQCQANLRTDLSGFILSTNDFYLAAGATQHVVLALVVADTSTHNHCGDSTFSFAGIKTVADTAWRGYYYGVTEVSQTRAHTGASVYPNPADGIVNVSFTGGVPETLQLYNAMGQLVPVQWNVKGKEATANVKALPVGLYHIRYTHDGVTGGIPFIKQ
jgi:hypothetical protein